MVNYLDSRRIAGTTAERSSIPTPATSGGWVELGRTTLGGTSDTITVSSLANKRYYMVLGHKLASGSADFAWRVGNGSADSGSNYSRRQSSNGGADGTNTSTDAMFADNGGATTPSFQVGYFANYATKEKLNITHSVGQSTAGAGTAPVRRESVSKWANTSNAIDVIQGYQQEAGDFASGSEVVVLGWDPTDSHTNNFWEELASVDLSGGAADTISTGTITAKKYLWVQCYVQQSGAGDTGITTRFNSDAGSNYAQRYSEDGGSDATYTSGTYLTTGVNSGTNADKEAFFYNFFVINNASNEKLITGHMVTNDAGLGAASAPQRSEYAWKWANTSNQITNITFNNTGGSADFGTETYLKVWGAD